MSEKQTKTVPDHFKFKTGSGIEYEAKRIENNYKISWISPYDNEDRCIHYGTEEVKSVVENGVWRITSVKAVIEDNSSTAIYPAGEALLRIKSFTEAVDALVTIISGTYEVHYANRIAFANTDEELDELMDAICVLDAAINK